MKQRAKRLNRDFFDRGAKIVAWELLGKRLVRALPSGRKIEGIITETEAYVGVRDKASHSFGGRRTKRNKVMYGQAGKLYVYFTYGMHWLANVVTSKEGDPQAVLLRGLDVISGPARLTKYLKIDRSFNGEDLIKSKAVWIEETGVRYKDGNIKKTPRIGVNYAKQWKDKKLRFLIESTK